jgi:hypothetical protein
MWSRAPAQRRRALLSPRRHRPPSALAGLYLTSQIEILLNCQVLGRNALSISSSQELCRFLPGCSPRPNDMVSRIFISSDWCRSRNGNHPSDRESPNGVPKRGDCDSRFFRKRRPSWHGHRPTRNVLHEGADDRHDTDAELWTSLSNNDWWLWIRAFAGTACREILCCGFAETMRGEITLPFSALSTSARAAPAFPSSGGEDPRYCLLPLPAPVFSPVRRRRFRCGALRTA